MSSSSSKEFFRSSLDLMSICQVQMVLWVQFKFSSQPEGWVNRQIICHCLPKYVKNSKIWWKYINMTKRCKKIHHYDKKNICLLWLCFRQPHYYIPLCGVLKSWLPLEICILELSRTFLKCYRQLYIP